MSSTPRGWHPPPARATLPRDGLFVALTLEGDAVQPVPGPGAEKLACLRRQDHARILETAEGADGAEAVARVGALQAHQPVLDLAVRGLGILGQRFVGEAGAAEAADGLDRSGRGRVVRPAVERVDALVVAEADADQHRLRPVRLRPHLADGVLDLLREERRVDLAGWEERLDELLVLPREPVRLLVAQARELAAQGLPQGRASVVLQPRQELDEHAVAKARPVHADVEEADVAELLARLVLAAEGRVHAQAADLGGPIEVVADLQHAVLHVLVDGVGVVLLLRHVEEDVRRVPGAVLGDDEAGPDGAPGLWILEHEEVLALEGVAHAPVEGAGRVVDRRRGLPLVVGKVHGVDLLRDLLEPGQVALLHVPDHVQRAPSISDPQVPHKSTMSDSYRSTAVASCASSMRSFAVWALPVLRPGPRTMASQPLRAKTPASVLVGLRRGVASRPRPASVRETRRTSSASSPSDMPVALRSTEMAKDSSPLPSRATQAAARVSNCLSSASGSCSGSRRASKVTATLPAPYTASAGDSSACESIRFIPPTAPGGSKRASSAGTCSARSCFHRSSSAPAVASARHRFGRSPVGGTSFIWSGAGSPRSRGAGTCTTQLAGTPLAAAPPRTERTGPPLACAHASARWMAFPPRCGVLECTALPAKVSSSMPGPLEETRRAFASRPVQGTPAE